MVAHDVGPSRRIREEYPETRWVSKARSYLFRLLEGSGSLAGLLELDKRKLRKDLHLLHYAEVTHHLHHLLTLKVFRNTAQPQLPHQDLARLLSDHSLGGLKRHADGIWWILDWWGVIGRVGIALDGWDIGRISNLRRVWHLGGEGLDVSLHFSAVSIIFDVHFPSGVPLLQGSNDIVGECLVALHRHKGVAKEVKSAASVIPLDDPAYL